MYCSSMLRLYVTSMKKLKIAYNNGLKRLLNLPKYDSASEMFVNLNIPSFSELLQKFVFNFKTRIMKFDNSLVNGIVTFTILLYHLIYPSQLKMSRIKPLFKSGDKSLFSNYRPISLLPSLSKIFERVIFDTLQTTTYYVLINLALDQVILLN